MASTKEGDWVLDPFNGSGTTGVAASLLGRKYLGIDMDTGYLELASKRREELENEEVRQAYKERKWLRIHLTTSRRATIPTG